MDLLGQKEGELSDDSSQRDLIAASVSTPLRDLDGEGTVSNQLGISAHQGHQATDL